MRTFSFHEAPFESVEDHIVAEMLMPHPEEPPDGALNRIYADERASLATQSWIRSSSRRAFATFRKAGASSLHLGRSTLEKMVQRTLKLPAPVSSTPSRFERPDSSGSLSPVLRRPSFSGHQLALRQAC
jgi:hypothetical protein